MHWYTGNTPFDTVLTIGLAFAALTILAAPFVDSPYGRFSSNKLGLNLHPMLGWWLMEIPATVVFLAFYIQGPHAWEPVPLCMALIWCIHYGNRGWFFPLSIRVAADRRSTFSVSVMAAGMFVTAIHGYLNATWFSELGAHFTSTDWFSDPRFIIGVLIYALGLYLILSSEYIVRNLRVPGEQGAYKIPYGAGYRFVSSPQYLGELIAWAGFATLTWGLPGVVIFLISAGNLVPRALTSHKWYQEKFPDYPNNRKALIPYVI